MTVDRINFKPFGRDGDASHFGEFGSERAGTPINTKDVALIQSLAAWLTGLQDAINASKKAPYLEDMNGLLFVFAYEIFYLLTAGIPEWNVDTTYDQACIVRKPATTQLFASRIGSNIGNALPASGVTDGNWSAIYPVNFSDLLGSIGLGQIPDGLITSAKIADLAATKLTGLITAAQIQSLDVSQLTGLLALAGGGTGVGHKLVEVTTYLGNGGDNHLVPHNLGVQPDIIIISAQVGIASQVVMWAPTFQTGYSRYLNGVPSTTDIKSADATNVNLGTSVYVNANGGGFTMLSLKSQ